MVSTSLRKASTSKTSTIPLLSINQRCALAVPQASHRVSDHGLITSNLFLLLFIPSAVFSRDVNQVGKPEYYEQLFAEQPPPLEDASSKISNVDKPQRRDSEATEIQAKIKRLKEAMITRYVPKPRDNGSLTLEPIICLTISNMFNLN